jgi:hypothetical protein
MVKFSELIFLRHEICTVVCDDNDDDDKVGTLNLSNLPVILAYVHQFNNLNGERGKKF